MRFTDRVTFVKETGGGYNSDAGRHEEPTRTENIMPCNFSPLGTDRTATLFGDIDTKATVVRLQRPYTKPFDYVEVNGTRMNVRRDINHRRQTVFYLEGAVL